MTGVPTTAVRVGVLGQGRIGRLHAELIEHRVPGARVTRVFDIDHERARTTAEALGVAVARSAAELIADDEVDAVAICTSTDTHVELILAAATARKAIFCEKPISLDLTAIDAAADAVATGGRLFQVGFNRRFDASHAAVRRAVEDGTVGEPHLVRITSRDPAPPPLEYVRTSGGLFLDMSVHDFDMARFLTGSEVVSVTARGAARIRPEFAEAGDVDTAVVLLEHADGCLTTIDNSRQARYGYDQRVEVHGSEAMAASENPHASTAVVNTANGTAAAPLPFFFTERYVAAYIAQWEAFVQAHHCGGEVPGIIDARAALLIGLAARRSREEHRTVAVAEVEQAVHTR